MRRTVFILSILLCACLVLAACGKKKDQPAQEKFTGFSNPEDLAKGYLKAIEDKDVEALRQLVISYDDLAAMKLGKAKKISKQHWMAYFSSVKRQFLTKNKDILGRKMSFVRFTPGMEMKLKPELSVFRGAQILAELPDKKLVKVEMNFLVQTKGLWKIVFLKYISPKGVAAKAQNQGMQQKGQKEPNMQVPTDKPKIDITVKKAEPKAEEGQEAPEQQGQPDPNESLEELKKLFGQ